MNKHNFQILAPLADVSDVDRLKAAGVDELYCGYITTELARQWPLAFLVLNRRGEGGSFEDHGRFQAAVRAARSQKIPVHVAVNGFYTSEQYKSLTRLIRDIVKEPGVYGVIVSDLGFLNYLKSMESFNKQIHLSTLTSCFNAEAINFYSSLGVSRVVLDRHLSVPEMQEMLCRASKNVDIEMFVLAGQCGLFVDGLCSLTHCFEKKDLKPLRGRKNVYYSERYGVSLLDRGCKMCAKVLLDGHFKVFEKASHRKVVGMLRANTQHYQFKGCRLCDLYDLKDYSIRSLKIAGRDMGLDDRVRQVQMVAQCRNYLLKPGISRRRYSEACRGIFSEVMLGGGRLCNSNDCCFPGWSNNE